MESKWLKLVIEYNEIKPYYIKKGIQEFSKEQNKGYEKEFVKFAQAVDTYDKVNSSIAKRYI